MDNKKSYTPQEVSKIIVAYLDRLHIDKDYLKLKMSSVEGAVTDVLNDPRIPLNVRESLDKERVDSCYCQRGWDAEKRMGDCKIQTAAQLNCSIPQKSISCFVCFVDFWGTSY